VFVAGALIPVHYLINGTTVARQARDFVQYFHIELPAHDLLLADGLLCPHSFRLRDNQ
jgi:Hint domain